MPINTVYGDFVMSSEEVRELLPAWFTERMIGDVWFFGLLTVDGTIIGIQRIEAIKQAADGSIWIDVQLLDSEPSNSSGKKLFLSPTSRTSASINTSHIVAAFELADT
jgi:hypothetical protein